MYYLKQYLLFELFHSCNNEEEKLKYALEISKLSYRKPTQKDIEWAKTIAKEL